MAYSVEDSTNTQIKLTWDELINDNTGGSPITNYEVEYNQGSIVNTWTVFELTEDNFSVVPTSGGETYQFRVNGINKFGPGTDSTTITVLAA